MTMMIMPMVMMVLTMGKTQTWMRKTNHTRPAEVQQRLPLVEMMGWRNQPWSVMKAEMVAMQWMEVIQVV